MIRYNLIVIKHSPLFLLFYIMIHIFRAEISYVSAKVEEGDKERDRMCGKVEDRATGSQYYDDLSRNDYTIMSETASPFSMCVL